jgi:UrcA family protein
MSVFNRTHRIRSIVAAALIAAACTGASAAADDAVVPAEFTFRFERAALGTPAGADAAYVRLVRSARRACRPIGGGRELWRDKLRRECAAGLIDKVVAKIASPRLTARHHGTAHYELARELEGTSRKRGRASS